MPLTEEIATKLALLYLAVLRRALPKGIPRTASGIGKLAAKFGLTVCVMDIPSRKKSYLVHHEIFVDKSLSAPERIIRVIHEIIEALTQTDMPGLIDDELLIMLAKPITRADRHQVAARAHELAAGELALTTPPGSSFSWRDWCHLMTARDRPRYSKPRPDTEGTDPFSDGTCI